MPIVRTDLTGYLSTNMPESRIARGEDIAELIEALPNDGEEHEIACPACGTVAIIRKNTPKE